MNRRNFLKKIAAVAAGAVALPAVAKKLPFKPNAAQYWWIRYSGSFPHPKLKKDSAFLYKVSKIPEYKVGSRYIILGDNGDYRVYKYIMSGQDCDYDPEKYVLGKM